MEEWFGERSTELWDPSANSRQWALPKEQCQQHKLGQPCGIPFSFNCQAKHPLLAVLGQVLPLQQLSGASAKQSARRDGAGIASQLLQHQAMPPVPACQHCVRTGMPFPGELLLDDLLIGQVKGQTCKRQERELAAPQLPSSSSTKHLLAWLMSLCYLDNSLL